MDFVYLFRVLLKRKWIILGSSLIAAAVVYFLTLNQPKQFKSSAQVATGYTTSDAVRLTNENVDYFGTETKFNNIIVTLTSPVVTSLLSYHLILHDLTAQYPFKTLTPEQKESPAFRELSKDSVAAAFRQRLQSMQMLSSSNPGDRKLSDFLGLYQYDLSSIDKALKVYRMPGTDYLHVNYLSPHPDLSAFAVNTIYEEFVRYYGTNRTKRSAESIDTLESIMNKRKEILDQRNNLLKQAGISTLEIENTGNIDVISNLEQALTEEKTKLSTYQSSLLKVNQRLADLDRRPAETTETNDDLIELRKIVNEAQREYLTNKDEASLKRYNTLNAEYQKKVLSRRTATITSKDPISEKMDLMTKKTDLEIDIQQSNSYIGSLQRQIGSFRGSVSSSASRLAATESLIKERDQANEEYLEAKSRYDNASDIGGVNINNFKVIVPGQPALNPEPSKRGIMIGLAAIAALFTTIAIIIFLTYLDSSIRTPVIFSKNVNLKLISLVNFMNLKNKNITDVIANKAVAIDEAEHKRNNIFRESLRKLRYEIETSGKKTFLFTSTKKGQGKTTLIQALASSMSLSKKRVLIIDTNFCNNDLTVQLNADPVLEKIIPSKSDKVALLEQVKVFSKDLGLGSVFAIGSQGGDYTPSEILPRENLLQHLESLTSDFDYIFLEGPPLNDFSDSRELAQYVDGVIAVFSAQDEIKQIDKQSISFFKELNGKFCGSILNMVDLKNINVA